MAAPTSVISNFYRLILAKILHNANTFKKIVKAKRENGKIFIAAPSPVICVCNDRGTKSKCLLQIVSSTN